MRTNFLCNPAYNKYLKYVNDKDVEDRDVRFFYLTTNGPVLNDSANLPSAEEVPNQLVDEAHRFVKERLGDPLKKGPNRAQVKYIFLDECARKVATDLGICPDMQLRFFVKAVLIVAEAVDYNIAVRYTMSKYGYNLKFSAIAYNSEVTLGDRTYVVDVQSTELLNPDKALLIKTVRGGEVKIVLVPSHVAAAMFEATGEFNMLDERMRRRWIAKDLYYAAKSRVQQ